jgi:hypothetical protein
LLPETNYLRYAILHISLKINKGKIVMSISSTIEAKFVFNESKSALEWFRKLTLDDNIYEDYIHEVSFKRVRVEHNYKFVVYLDSSNRNFFYERWFLMKLLKGVSSEEIQPNDKDFCECFREINAKYKCAIEWIASSEHGIQDHIVWDYDGKIILEESDKWDFETDEHSNPDFNKQNIETLLLK